MISRIYQGPRSTLAKATSLLEVAQKKAARVHKDFTNKALEVGKLVHAGNNFLNVMTVTATMALNDLETGDSTTEALKEDLETIEKNGRLLAKTLTSIRELFIPSSKIRPSSIPPVGPISLDGKTMTIKNILIVDDAPTFRIILESTLTKAGYSVTQATNAEEAITLLAAKQFDLIITDVDMNPEGMNGLELAKLVAKDQPQTKIFVMSGDDTGERAATARQNGAEQFFPKPLNVEDILSAIRG